MADEKTYGFTESKSKKEVYTKEVMDNLINNLKTESGENYIKFENGILMQWGNVTHGAFGTVTSNIVLPIEFKNQGYRVIVTPCRNGSAVERYWVGNASGTNTKEAGKFSISDEARTGTTYWERAYDWFAIGRWK